MFPAIRRAAAGAALVLILLAPSAVAGVGHVSVEAKGPGGRSLIAPGDDITLRETIANTGVAPITGALTGVLGSANSDVADTTPRTFPTPLIPGDTTYNPTPFNAHVPSTLPCGRPLNFSVGFDGAATGNLSFTVPTGTPGPAVAFDAPPGAMSIPDDGHAHESQLYVPVAGTIKSLRVRIESLVHQDIGDLQLVLVGPGLNPVTLMRVGQGSGPDLTGAVFAPVATRPIAEPPHAGTWLADGLSAVVGHDQLGLWRLQVTDAVSGHAEGVLDGWTLESSPPVCDAQAQADLTVTPATLGTGPTAVGTFDASGSQDPKGKLANFHWEFGDGVTDDTGTVDHATHYYTTRGIKKATVTMQDAAGVTLSQKSVDVKVDQPPAATLAGADPEPAADVDADVTLDATGSTHDPSGSIMHYEWDLNGDGVYETDGGTSPTKQFNLYGSGMIRTSGAHTVGVRVTDDVGITAAVRKTIDVGDLAPVPAFTPPPGYVATGRPLMLDGGASSDRDGSIATYQWDFDGDGVPDASTPTTSFSPPSAGDYPVTLTTTDDKGVNSSVTHLVQVADPPTVTVSPPPSLVARNVGVTLTAAGASANGSALAWSWDLAGGDAAPITGPTMRTVSFSTFGTHTVRVRATDDHGLTTEVPVAIVVANQAPAAVLAVSASSVATGAPVPFDATGSHDPDGAISEYRFDLDGDGAYETRGTAPTATASYPNPGHVDARVQVVDNDGGTSTATVGVNIVAPVGAGGTGGTTAGGSTPPADPPSPLGPGTIIVTSPGGGAVPAGTSSVTPAHPLTAALGGSTVQVLKRVLKSGIVLTCTVDRAATCSASLTMRATDARRMRISSARGSKPVVIGAASVSSAGAGAAELTVRVRASAARRLARVHRLVLQASGTARDATGSTVKITRSLLVRG